MYDTQALENQTMQMWQNILKTIHEQQDQNTNNYVNQRSMTYIKQTLQNCGYQMTQNAKKTHQQHQFKG